MDGNRSLSKGERAIRDHAAENQLVSLVKSGCDRARLLMILDLAFLTDETWNALVGMDLRSLKATLAGIRSCAAMIERLNRSELLYRVSIEMRDPRFVELHRPPTLPDRLRTYAKAIESLPKVFGPKRKLSMHLWKAHLVAMVLEQTGKTHDREASSRIAAVLNRPGYSEKAHQAWRLKHVSLVEKARIREQSRPR
jgi:hypothetical protein